MLARIKYIVFYFALLAVCANLQFDNNYEHEAIYCLTVLSVGGIFAVSIPIQNHLPICCVTGIAETIWYIRRLIIARPEGHLALLILLDFVFVVIGTVLYANISGLACIGGRKGTAMRCLKAYKKEVNEFNYEIHIYNRLKNEYQELEEKFGIDQGFFEKIGRKLGGSEIQWIESLERKKPVGSLTGVVGLAALTPASVERIGEEMQKWDQYKRWLDQNQAKLRARNEQICVQSKHMKNVLEETESMIRKDCPEAIRTELEGMAKETLQILNKQNKDAKKIKRRL